MASMSFTGVQSGMPAAGLGRSRKKPTDWDSTGGIPGTDTSVQ